MELLKKIVLLVIVVFWITNLSAQIPKDSLVFYVPFNGSFKDSAGKISGVNYGSLLHTDRHTQDSVAIYLDGANDWVDYGTAIKMTDIDDFTSALWVQPSAVSYSQPGGPKSGRYTIFGNAAAGAGFRFFQEKNELHFSVAPGTGTDNCYYELNNSELSNWIHLIGVSNNGKLSIYANGNHISTVNAQGTSRKLGQINMEVGRGSKNNNVYWEGKVDEIRIYNRAFSSKEAKALYRAELLGFCSEKIIDSVTIQDTNWVTIIDTVNVYNRINDTTTYYDTTTIKVTRIDTNYLVVSDTTWIIDTLWATVLDTIKYTINDSFKIRTYDTVDVVFYDSVITRVKVIDSISVDDTLNIMVETGLVSYPFHKLKLYTNPSGTILYIDVGDYTEITEFNFSITKPSGQKIWSRFANSSQFEITMESLGSLGLLNFNVYDEPDNLIVRKALMIYKKD